MQYRPRPLKQVKIFLFLLFFFASTSSAQINTLSTGIGLDQREQAHPEFPLKLVFFVEGGAYLADINVEIIMSGSEKIVDTNSSGPWFFAALENGNYVVTATRKNGDIQRVSFSIQGNQQKVISLMFPNR